MFQIDNSTAVAAIPAPTPAGPPGYFTDGNPATGVSATILPAEFMNMLMMENINVLSAAGITPAKGQYNQLSLAIAKIIKDGAAGAASEAAAGILKLSSTAQAIAGADDLTAITPLKLAQKLGNYLVQATEGVFGWLKIATQVLVNAGVDDATAVTPKKLAATAQSQVFTAFTAGGTAPAFTLTPTPAITAYAPDQRFQVSFGAAGGAAPTLNVSGRGAKSLKQYNSAGAKVAAIIAAGQTADVFYDGTDFVLLDPLPVNSLVVGSGGWLASAPLATGTIGGIAGSQLFSGVSPTTTDTPFANSVGMHMIFTNTSFGADIAISINDAQGSLFYRTLGGASTGAWRTVWDNGNFNPATKMNTQFCSNGGFTDSTITTPFFTHSNGTTVPLAKRDDAFGVQQSWQDVKAARAANTNYTNATARTIQVNISSGDASARSLIVNGVVAAYTNTTYGGNYFLTAMVPPGGTYSYTGSFSNWAEFR